MGEAAEKLPEVRIPFVRRFERADINKHADWLIPRLLVFLPHLTPTGLHGWLLNILSSNEFMFLYQDKSVALAQMIPDSPRPGNIIQEVFVWCKDPKDEAQVQDAAYFYDHFQNWAKRRDIQTLMIENSTDIPRKLIGDVTGRRVFETKVAYMRVRE